MYIRRGGLVMIRRRPFSLNRLVSRFQSTSVSHHNPSNSLELDFVLSLLDSSSVAKKLKSNETQQSTWSRMKFKVIEPEEITEKDANSNGKLMSNFYNCF